MSDEWADAMNDFRSAVYRALNQGVTIDDMRDDLDNVEVEEEDDYEG